MSFGETVKLHPLCAIMLAGRPNFSQFEVQKNEEKGLFFLKSCSDAEEEHKKCVQCLGMRTSVFHYNMHKHGCHPLGSFTVGPS